jgi:hypothetical protein
MGKPINKRYIGDVATPGQQINPTAYFIGKGSTSPAYIVKQLSENTYLMNDTTNTYQDKVHLVNGGAALSAGQANVTVQPYGSSGDGAAGAVANLGILSATVSSGGTGTSANYYVPGQILNPSTGSYTTGQRGNLYVGSVKLGTVSVTANTGYTVGDTFTWNYAGFETPVVLTVATTTGNGNIGGVTISSAGSVSNVNITNTTPYSSSTTANAWATSARFSIRWDVLDFNVSNPGDYYNSIPSNPVTLTNSAHGTGATANIAWKVSSVKVTNPGNLYLAASVGFTGSTPAVATATVNQIPNQTTSGNVTAVAVSYGGMYTNVPPTVTISTIRRVEYARVIKNLTVETFQGNEYSWVPTGVTPVDGQAVIQTA